MENHYFDAAGVYLFSAPANPGSLPPANAIRAAPPPDPAGRRPVLNAARDGWQLPPPAGTEAAGPANSAAAIAADAAAAGREEVFYLTRKARVYHRAGCLHIARYAGGKWLTLAELRERRGKSRPCGYCRPEGKDMP